MAINRQARESVQLKGVPQGEDEEVPYSFSTLPWGGSPSGVSAEVKDMTEGGTDVTADVMPGTPIVAGDTITLPKLKLLTDGHTYRVEVLFATLGKTLEAFFFVKAEM